MDGNVTQWFNEDGLSQKQILTDFLAFIQPYNTLITFNGKPLIFLFDIEDQGV